MICFVQSQYETNAFEVSRGVPGNFAYEANAFLWFQSSLKQNHNETQAFSFNPKQNQCKTIACSFDPKQHQSKTNDFGCP